MRTCRVCATPRRKLDADDVCLVCAPIVLRVGLAAAIAKASKRRTDRAFIEAKGRG